MFIGRFWAFRPEHVPLITFARAVYRDSLLSEALPRDRIAIVVTQCESGKKRGHLLGLAEIGSHPVDTTDVVDLESLTPRERVGGQPRCPKAIPMRRAWRFVESPLLPNDVEKRIPQETGAAAIALTSDEAHCIFGFRHRPVPVHELTMLLATFEKPNASPRGEVFVFRFGNRDVWKIESSFGAQSDTEGINRNVPAIVIREAWEILFREPVTSKTEALIFVTRLAESLADYRSPGDMFICPQATLERAWKFVLTELRGVNA